MDIYTGVQVGGNILGLIDDPTDIYKCIYRSSSGEGNPLGLADSRDSKCSHFDISDLSSYITVKPNGSLQSPIQSKLCKFYDTMDSTPHLACKNNVNDSVVTIYTQQSDQNSPNTMIRRL
jgi:hypothetical protein